MTLHSKDQLIQEALLVWESGGWLMLPLALISIFVYFTALELYFRLMFHPLLKKNHQYSEGLIEIDKDLQLSLREQVKRIANQYQQLREQFLHKIKRRTKFLSIIIPISPLMGLLGTVLGILNMFNGMVVSQANRFEQVVSGINKALITTQTGLIIAIPAYFILTLIKQKRKKLELSIYQIEQNHIKQFLKQSSNTEA